MVSWLQNDIIYVNKIGCRLITLNIFLFLFVLQIVTDAHYEKMLEVSKCINVTHYTNPLPFLQGELRGTSSNHRGPIFYIKWNR